MDRISLQQVEETYLRVKSVTKQLVYLSPTKDHANGNMSIFRQKKIFWPEEERFVRIRVSARTIRTIEKKGISSLAKNTGIDLRKLAFDDVRPARLLYLTQNPMQVPRAKNPKNKMKNSERLAASLKKPILPCYIDGCIFWLRDGEVDKIYQLILAQKEADLAGQMALREAEAAALKAKKQN